MKTISPTGQHVLQLTADEEAVIKCETALALKDQADVNGALKAMRPFWKQVGERPSTEGSSPCSGC